MLQKFDFDSYRTTSNVTTLSKILSCTYLNLANQNSVFKIYTMSKGRYAYWISSDSPYKMLSIADYLTEYESYSSKIFTVDYAPMEENCYQTLCRIKISHEGEDKNAILLKMKNCPKEVEKYLNYKIVSTPVLASTPAKKWKGWSKKIRIVFSCAMSILEPSLIPLPPITCSLKPTHLVAFLMVLLNLSSSASRLMLRSNKLSRFSPTNLFKNISQINMRVFSGKESFATLWRMLVLFSK